MKKQLTLLFALVLACPLATAVFAQDTPAKSKEMRFEGRVERSSKEQSSLTSKVGSSTLERTVVYDSSTKWVSQYHADKNVNVIDPGEVKDGDYVICTGTWDHGKLHATLVSKRLSHPN